MRTNYVLIDYENVQPTSLELLDQEHFRIIVFVGSGQAKIAFETAAALQPLGARVAYVRSSGNGPNALDFHIAFYVGQLSAREPDACFHIISKDTGFDPLIQHLRSKKVRAYRSSDIAGIPLLRTSSATVRADQMALVVADLRQRGTSRPRTIVTLSGTINALFQKRLSEGDVALLVHELQSQGIVTVNDAKVSYALPA